MPLPLLVMSRCRGRAASLIRRIIAGLTVCGAVAPGWSQTAEPLTSTPLAARSRATGATLFSVVPAESSGVRTENRYADPRMWGELYHEFEIGPIGTGVAIGDYDNDGRPDLFVVAKTESCRLFRNLGDWKFEDVSEKAGIADRGAAAAVWKQGVTFDDVNNDGWLDVYVCRFNAPNLLYLNQQDGTFREAARAAGLDVVDSSVMAAFADYDRDGWLDVFVQTNLLNNAERPAGQRDFLFRNRGDGTFVNVTAGSGVDGGETQGNSAAWWDYNQDGWPDLYVANDFAAPDRLYRNNGDGTFTNVTDEVLPHVPYSSMGTDIGDVNNDGWIDLLATDMAATTHEKDQRSMAETRGRTKDPADGSTAIPNYLRNALYVNTGVGRCLEAAFLTGLAATDWTWSVRFEDLDNDGWLDLHVTNGMHREIHNSDLIHRMMTTEGAADRIRVARSSPILAENNLVYRNLGDLQFDEVGATWGLNQNGVSFGAAFGDLDGDGDLDVVYSNYLAGVTLLRNDGATGHRVLVALRGQASNRFGVGAVVRLETDRGTQVRQLSLARGYMSASDLVLHFGLGQETVVRRLTVIWPSGHEQAFERLEANARYTITEPGDKPLRGATPAPLPAGQFKEATTAVNLGWSAKEELIDEIAQQRLLPVRLNRRGPALAAGDLNGDGRDELVMGGTSVDPARVLFQDGAGRFDVVGRLGRTGTVVNDGPVLLFDGNGDGRLDVLITKGGNSAPAGAPEYEPELFLGGEKGLHRAPPGTLPEIAESIGAAAAVDFNGDGLLDLFLGGRASPGLYPLSPRSFLLLNRGGRFEDVTDPWAAGLREAGMVTSCLWSDVDGDGWPDLLVAIEWGHVRYFHNNAGRLLEDWTERAGFAAGGLGWWTSLASADFNGDGRPDFAAGNAGLNTPYRASASEPAVLLVQEPPEGGSLRLVEAYAEGGRWLPRRSRRDLASILPTVSRRFPRTDPYAKATLEEVLGPEFIRTAQRYEATELRSGVFLSAPDGRYRFAPLPRLLQISPVQGLVVGDFNADGFVDLFAAQNSYAPTPVVGRWDGGLGQLLHGDGTGTFAPVPVAQSRLVVPGDAKAVLALDPNEDGWADIWVSRNNQPSLFFENGGMTGNHPLQIRLTGRGINPTASGARVMVEYASGRREMQEVRAGSGWMSQSSSSCFFGYSEKDPAATVHVRWPDGRDTRHVVVRDTPVMRIAQPD